MRRVLTQKDLGPKKGIKYSRQHLDRKVTDGTFPPPFHLPGSVLNLWFEDVIDAYLEACAAGQDWREAVAKLNPHHANPVRRAVSPDSPTLA